MISSLRPGSRPRERMRKRAAEKKIPNKKRPFSPEKLSVSSSLSLCVCVCVSQLQAPGVHSGNMSAN